MPKEPGAGPISDALAAVIRGRINSFSPPWTVDELADCAGIVRKTLQTRMTKVRARAIPFRAEEIHAIAQALGTSGDELFHDALDSMGDVPPFNPLRGGPPPR